MRNLEVRVCLISARGLRKVASPLMRVQWFAVAWIDPNSKYCTKVTASRNSIPIWNTKFLATVDAEAKARNDLALHVQVYSREPLFLRETLEGEATVGLREFLDKYVNNSERVYQGAEELGSFQLRQPKSGKARGFVDISIQISRERDAQNLPLGTGEGFQLRNQVVVSTGVYHTQRDQPGSSHWTTLSGQ